MLLLDKMERIRNKNSRLEHTILRISLEAHDKVACVVLEEEGKIVRRIYMKKKRLKQQATNNCQMNSPMLSLINSCVLKAADVRSIRKHLKSTFHFARKSSNRRNRQLKCQTRWPKRIRPRVINLIQSNRNYLQNRRKHLQERQSLHQMECKRRKTKH